jgi:hypothetical protein
MLALLARDVLGSVPAAEHLEQDRTAIILFVVGPVNVRFELVRKRFVDGESWMSGHEPPVLFQSLRTPQVCLKSGVKPLPWLQSKLQKRNPCHPAKVTRPEGNNAMGPALTSCPPMGLFWRKMNNFSFFHAMDFKAP